MLLAGNKIKIQSKNLNYPRLLLITLLLGEFFRNLFPYQSTVAAIIILLWPLKSH